MLREGSLSPFLLLISPKEEMNMAAITAGLVKELRDRTGLGMMECKKALTETDGDIEVAIDNLRKSGATKAAKKSANIAAEGAVHFAVLAREKEIYAAKARESGKPENIVEKMIEGSLKKYLAEVSLVEQAFVKDPDVKVADLLKKAGATVVSFIRLEVGEGIEKKEVDFAAEVAAQVAASAK